MLGALGGAAALMAIAVARGGGGSSDATPATSPGSSMPGMMVAIDPATGQLRTPTPEEMAALQAADPSRRKGKNTDGVLRSETLKNGAVVTTLDPSYDLYSVVAKDADGKMRTACVPGYQLDATLAAAEKMASQTEEVVDEK